MDKEPLRITDYSQLGKVPPQSVDVEEVVLGAIMLEKDAVIAVSDILTPDDFYKDAHVKIFTAITQLFAENQPIDIKTVKNQLQKNGTLDLVGGAYYVADLTSKINSSAHIKEHCLIIKENSLRRSLIEICSKALQDAYDDTVDVFSIIDRLDHQVTGLYSGHSDTIHIGDNDKVMEVINDVETAKKSRENNETIGVPTGFKALDKFTGGWQLSDLIIVAARPGMGKSAFVATALKAIGIDRSIPCAMFSLEMAWKQTSARIMAMSSDVHLESMRNGSINNHDFERLLHKSSFMVNKPIYIDDTPSLSITQMKSKAKYLKKKYDIKILFVDYIQLGEGHEHDKKSNREQAVSQISRGLKHIAKELNIPVVALSQLSRAVETRGGDKRPLLSDLRESGSIEQDADVVVFLYRPEYYGLTQNEDGMPLNGLGEVIFAKHRHGRLGSEYLKFIGKFTKWSDLEPEIEPAMAMDFEKNDFTIVLPSKNENTRPNSK